MSGTEDKTEAEDKTAALLAALWVKNRPVIEERLAALERAATDRSVEAQNEGKSAAHKLAGALGMYGFDEGTQIARVIDSMLEDAVVDPGPLRELIAELRRVIFPAG